jgi:hypothetical protein
VSIRHSEQRSVCFGGCGTADLLWDLVMQLRGHRRSVACTMAWCRIQEVCAPSGDRPQHPNQPEVTPFNPSIIRDHVMVVD